MDQGFLARPKHFGCMELAEVAGGEETGGE